MRVGIVGCGTIGRAIASGLLAHAAVTSMIATTRRGEPIDALPHVSVDCDNRSLAANSDIVFLCVKPFQLEAVLRDIAPVLSPDALLISTAASVTLAQLHAWSDGHGHIVRAMPNMPCRIGEGMTVVASEDRDAARIEVARSLFSTLGRSIVIEERLMDAATGLSGCGPAYVYLIIEALTDAGVKLGFSHTVARELVAQTVMGSAQMVLDSGLHPAALKMEVTTPAGCTVDGLMELEDGKLRSTLLRAAVAAARRSTLLAEDA